MALPEKDWFTLEELAERWARLTQESVRVSDILHWAAGFDSIPILSLSIFYYGDAYGRDGHVWCHRGSAKPPSTDEVAAEILQTGSTLITSLKDTDGKWFDPVDEVKPDDAIIRNPAPHMGPELPGSEIRTYHCDLIRTPREHLPGGLRWPDDDFKYYKIKSLHITVADLLVTRKERDRFEAAHAIGQTTPPLPDLSDPRHRYPNAFAKKITLTELMQRWNVTLEYLQETVKTTLRTIRQGHNPNVQLIPWRYGVPALLNADRFGFPRNPNPQATTEPDLPINGVVPGANIEWFDSIPDNAYFPLPQVLAFEEINPYVQRQPAISTPVETQKKTAQKPRQNQLDRERCRAIAQKTWAEDPSITITDMIGQDEITATACEHRQYDHDTLRSWIKDLCPDRSPGRRPTKLNR